MTELVTSCEKRKTNLKGFVATSMQDMKFMLDKGHDFRNFRHLKITRYTVQ